MWAVVDQALSAQESRCCWPAYLMDVGHLLVVAWFILWNGRLQLLEC